MTKSIKTISAKSVAIENTPATTETAIGGTFVREFCGKVYNDSKALSAAIETAFKSATVGADGKISYSLVGFPAVYRTKNFTQFRADERKYGIRAVF